MAALFVVAPKLDQPRCPSKSEWLNCGTYKPWNTTQAEKGMSHRYTCSDLGESQGMMLGGKKKAITKGCTLYDSIYVTFLQLNILEIYISRVWAGWV